MPQPAKNSDFLSASVVAAIIERSGLSRGELAAKLGCGTSQLFKYEHEGVPPRMDRNVLAGILQLGLDTGVIESSASLRAMIAKLVKGQQPVR